MRVLCEVTTEKDEQPIDGEIAYERTNWWLLHWGLQFEIIDIGEEKRVAVNYTTAICENYETGQVETFLPSQLRIIGTEIKK